MTARYDASRAYAAHVRATYEAPSPETDEIFFDGIAWQVSRLVRSIVKLRTHTDVEARPNAALLAAMLCDVIDDTIDAPAANVIRAQVMQELEG